MLGKHAEKIGFGAALGGAGVIELLASGGPCPLCVASIGGGAFSAAGGFLALTFGNFSDADKKISARRNKKTIVPEIKK